MNFHIVVMNWHDNCKIVIYYQHTVRFPRKKIIIWYESLITVAVGYYGLSMWVQLVPEILSNKGQIKSKAGLAHCRFSQKTNERICFVCCEKQKCKQNKFVCSYFWRVYAFGFIWPLASFLVHVFCLKSIWHVEFSNI